MLENMKNVHAVRVCLYDTFIDKQWYLENPGTEAWQQPGADIRVSDAWKECTGDPRIIVAVMDGGIQVNHPDLVDNIWVNEEKTPETVSMMTGMVI